MISPEKLRCFPLFAGLTDAVLKAVAMAGEEMPLSKGAWLFYEGNEANALYVILEGKVRLKIALDRERTYHADLDTLGEGDVIGWSALVEPYTYTLSAVAMTDVRLAKLDGVSLCEIMAHDTGAGYLLMSRLMQIVGIRLATIHARFASLVEGERWQRVATRKPEN
jgi:CRP-like cAMP-binding protein